MSLYETRVEQGRLEGIDKGDYALYRGVPYAEPPVDGLRFCAPKKKEGWHGVRKATENPPIAWQTPQPAGSFYEKEFYAGDESIRNRSEDCLYLNIWTPAQKKSDGLPVLFWIHGGAFRHGFGHEREFDGKACCKRGIILVTIQYRLGIFGFFDHPWLGQTGGSLAIQDQIAALKWVYDNIGEFGGDAGKITVAGQSAGGVSVQALLCAPQTEGRIHQAILQSGGGYGQLERRCQTKRDALKAGIGFTQKYGIPSLEELKKIEAQALLKMADEYAFPCRITVSGDGQSGIMPEKSLYEKSRVKLPCLMGSNKNDIRVTQEMVQKGIPSDLYVGNMEFARQYGTQNNCYLYYFERQLPGDAAGAFHSAELWYMFGTLGRSWRPFAEADTVLSERMLDAWCRFVKKGHPGEREGEWEAYREEKPYIHVWR